MFTKVLSINACWKYHTPFKFLSTILSYYLTVLLLDMHNLKILE